VPAAEPAISGSRKANDAPDDELGQSPMAYSGNHVRLSSITERRNPSAPPRHASHHVRTPSEPFLKRRWDSRNRTKTAKAASSNAPARSKEFRRYTLAAKAVSSRTRKFALNAFIKARNADDHSLVDAAADHFDLIARLHLERDDTAFDAQNYGGRGHL
jgi:hypothetical protein